MSEVTAAGEGVTSWRCRQDTRIYSGSISATNTGLGCNIGGLMTYNVAITCSLCGLLYINVGYEFNTE